MATTVEPLVARLRARIAADGPMAFSGTWMLGNGGAPLGGGVPLAGPAEAFDFEFKPD